MKVLFIGNSYTYYNDMPDLFEKLAKENGADVQVMSVTQGGRRLKAYENDADEYTLRLKQIMAEHHFDAVIVQEHSLAPILDYDGFCRGVIRVLDMVRPKAERVILYETWGRKSGSPELSEHGWTNEGMTRDLADAYAKVAKNRDLEVSHVGQAFRRIVEACGQIELYYPDMTHPSYAGSCLAALVHYKTVFEAMPVSAECLGLNEKVLSAFVAAIA